ncbi:MAG: NADH:flavin oxidoreductase/NADH oxidase protein [Devosia sp.]|uniref:NADH-dependent flavin oxidoreductase n=1 Tax=Devosia sp. TaxID=1871048 RepID=UPI00262E2900|nr:NADH-dependent flavin oxidoreductase [Devosia sp.]MDB5527389.1 NADH:flavin oxidoreductase/NADH oxidase protein [Devosia sp.]
MNSARQALFAPLTLPSGVVMRNRVVMAPMTTWSGNADGTVTDEEVAYYEKRVGGAGLIITGCTQVQANGIGFTDEFASFDDGFIPSLRRLADAAKSGGAPALLQIFHAGNKAVAELTPSKEVVSASTVGIVGNVFAAETKPRELSENEVIDVIKAFGDAVRRAIEAGFDGIELHGAHGFLIQNFFSPHYNKRQDQWGGSLENRMRFALAVVAEVKRVAEAHATRPFALGYRISVEEPEEDGLRIDDSLILIDRLIAAEVDYVHVSLGSVLQNKPIGGSGSETIIQVVLNHVAGRLPVFAAGQILIPAQADTALALGLAAVAVGRGLVINPNWVELAKAGSDTSIAMALDPADVSDLQIPGKLWGIIQAMTGWFTLKTANAAAAE